jgi:aspartyl/asparaginyl beta-hydroxylase (cupin superfamily)
MYYETARFPFTATLEQNWRVIRAELDALDRHEFIDWPEHSLYGDRGWETFGLYALVSGSPRDVHAVRRLKSWCGRFPA